MRQSKSGEIDKIGIASRIIRGKKENSDDGYRAGVATKVIEYLVKLFVYLGKLQRKH